MQQDYVFAYLNAGYAFNMRFLALPISLPIYHVYSVCQ